MTAPTKAGHPCLLPNEALGVAVDNASAQIASLGDTINVRPLVIGGAGIFLHVQGPTGPQSIAVSDEALEAFLNACGEALTASKTLWATHPTVGPKEAHLRNQALRFRQASEQAHAAAEAEAQAQATPPPAEAAPGVEVG